MLEKQQKMSNGVKGFYLYGICPVLKLERSRDMEADIKGIDDVGKVFFAPYNDIAAVVSEVSLKEFDSEEIEKKAKEDLQWIKDKASRHDEVIKAAIKIDGDSLAIIPMKFGTIFKTKKNLADSLEKNYLRFKELFETLKGREEWSMKIYLKLRLLENGIKKTSVVIKEKSKELCSMPAGRTYFLEKEIDEMAAAEAKKSVSGYISVFLEKIKLLAEEAKENKILEKEITQKSEPMIFNGAFLVKKEKVDEFQKEIQKLRAEYEKIGFVFELSGPWPPYNFV
ncbi:GvpL/GvpF family gas vesicle protein [Patescibacteria group bacterium]|nr:GvpL/GvpF family gas vesicle protein [Patescibacteria group bacterium]